MGSRTHEVVEAEYRSALAILNALHELLIDHNRSVLLRPDIDRILADSVRQEKRIAVLAVELKALGEPSWTQSACGPTPLRSIADKAAGAAAHHDRSGSAFGWK